MAAAGDVLRGIGHFEFGGSTHMMIFQRDHVELADWAVNAASHRSDRKPTPMGSVIACPTFKHVERPAAAEGVEFPTTGRSS